jgi:hypothetical protein
MNLHSWTGAPLVARLSERPRVGCACFFSDGVFGWGFAKNGYFLWFCGGQKVVRCMVKRGVWMVLNSVQNLRQLFKFFLQAAS